MKQIRTTTEFERDVKRLRKRNKNLEKIEVVVRKLVHGALLPKQYRPHKLVGSYFPKWECHIEPDWILIYEIKDDEVILYRTGTHADLF